MKKYILYIALSTLIFLYSCGGTIGRIERYTFDGVSNKQMTATFDSLYKVHPEWIPPIGCIYNRDGHGNYDSTYQEYMLYLDKPKPLILSFKIANYPDSTSSSNITTVVLISGAEFGDVIGFERDLKNDDRELFKQLFEDKFLKEINKSLSIDYIID